MRNSFGYLVVVALVLISAIGLAESKIVGKTVEYRTQGVVMKGYLAYDGSVGQAAGRTGYS